MTRRFFVSIAIAFLLAVANTATAAGNVAVTLKISAGHYNVTKSSCAVSVPETSDGEAVLEAARVSGCISSYTITRHPAFGAYVSCIDAICEVPGTYWAMRENCLYTDYGLDGFSATQGDELSFTYESWGHYLLPQPCA